MARRTIKEKEIIKHLKKHGFKELKPTKETDKWYKKASEIPHCLKITKEKKIINSGKVGNR